ncbi:MAG: MerR family transcriptional regulator [Firmicutes bacterium]|nr:MerR family transcriptional regulator [Bacillota bacterium]
MTVPGKTLSETAAEVGVEPSTIKYWCEEFSNFIRPARTPGGHRRFSDKDIQDLRYIRQLLHFQNLSIKQVKEMLNEKGTDQPEFQTEETGLVPGASATPTVPAMAALAQELANYLEKQMELIAHQQLKAVQAALEQTAATVLDEVRDLEAERFEHWTRFIEHSAGKNNERILAAVQELKRSPQELEEIKRMYAEAKDRWLIEEAKVRMEIQRLKHELDEVQNQSLWQRLVWALFGRSRRLTETDSSDKSTDPAE